VDRHTVRLAPPVARTLARLRGPVFVALRGVILGLADDPRPPAARKLTGAVDLWRIRLRIDGEPWRVVYRLDARRREVVVTRMARRDESTYRHLPR
jgi:mRNA interferase RelE/StbE